MAHQMIIYLVVLCASCLFPAQVRGGMNPYEWRCKREGIGFPHIWHDAIDQCKFKRGFCRNICVLQKVRVLSSNLEFQEQATKEVIAASVPRLPETHQNLLEGIRICAKRADDTDRTFLCQLNAPFIHCLNELLKGVCEVDRYHFWFPDDTPKLLPPPMIIQAPPPPTKSPGIFGAIFG